MMDDYQKYVSNMYGEGNGQGTQNGYTAQNPQPAMQPVYTPQTPVKKSKKKGAFGKAVLACVLGLAFGASAGGGFYAVNLATGSFGNSGNKEVITQNADDQAAADPISNFGQEDEGEGAQESSDQAQVTPSGNTAGSVSTLLSSAKMDVSDVARSTMPSMVCITEYYTNTTYNFFGGSYTQEVPASGSGIIIGETDDEYLIVTNNHVVKDANKLEVIFFNDTTVNASIKGTDKKRDIAVVAVQKGDVDPDTRSAITIAKIGDSDKLELGEEVVAIGNALGYGLSVTNGVVSALDREMQTEDGYTNTFIQTNAAINPGNSGGALLNMKGEVVGINSNKLGGTTVEGMGYAIPVSSVTELISSLIEKSSRTVYSDEDMGYIGIKLQTIDSQTSAYYRIPVGIYVTDVIEDTGAEKAGLRKGDVITGFAGEEIESYSDLQNVTKYYTVGDEVEVVYMRLENGEYHEEKVMLTLGKKPADMG